MPECKKLACCILCWWSWEKVKMCVLIVSGSLRDTSPFCFGGGGWDWTNNGGGLTNVEEMALLELIATWQLSHQCNALSLSSVQGYSQFTSQTCHTQWRGSLKQAWGKTDQEKVHALGTLGTNQIALKCFSKPVNSRNSSALSPVTHQWRVQVSA